MSGGYLPLATDSPTATDATGPFDSGTAQVRHLVGGGLLRVEPGGKAYSYAYGVGGLAGLVHNYYALGCALFASLGGLTFGYDQGVVANVLVMRDFQMQFPMTPLQQGLLTAVLELGALFGALAAGILADRLSRRYAICTGCAIFCVGSAFQASASTLWWLGLGRALGGVGIGSLSMLCPLYMSEISPPEVRGSLLSIEQFSIVLGVVVGFWIGFCTRSIQGSASWRIPLGIQLVPGLLLAVGCLYLPPSPRLLVYKGRQAEALASLAQLRQRPDSDDPLVHLELAEMEVDARMTWEAEGADGGDRSLLSEIRSWRLLFHREYISRSLIGIMVMVFQQWSGINALLYYGPTLLGKMGLAGDTVLLVGSGFINIVQFLAVAPAILYIDRVGRKPLLTSGAAVMAFSHASIALLVYSGQDDWANHQTKAWCAVGFVYLFTAAYGVSIGPIAWVLPSEIFPLVVRSKGVALSTASNWLNNFVVGLITPALIQASPAGTYVIFAMSCLGAYIWAKYIVPETRGRSLEEMDVLFRSSAGREHERRKQEISAEYGLHAKVRALLESGDGE